MASIERKKMDNALKQVVIPVLREQGFKGSLTHFRRMNENNIDLLTFEFNKWGGSFTVAVGICPKEGVTWEGEKIPLNKINVYDVEDRLKLGNKTFADGNTIVFDYENAKTEEDYKRVAEEVLSLLKTSDVSWITSLVK
ncbi:DUF4304 domain-containing protein [Niallia sp. Man26]|uniref:DUF4304 domain-containing protein n=1 Tax=Niallia sp. Man26 TaxID=2912824 RepID=UPI001EDC6C1C|nr:DUF4304 domain-containing protein [Niallia sp. Man26]UPO91038.1 DUF4304 domain-containing protein [Niallia sp. Man26]